MNSMQTPVRLSVSVLITGSVLVACWFLSVLPGWGQKRPAAVPSTRPVPVESGVLTGKVIETTNAMSYTYVQLNTGSKKLWLAAPQFAVKIGDTVSAESSMPMYQFHSKALKRDFDVVYFAGEVKLNGQPVGARKSGELPKDHPAIDGRESKGAIEVSGIQKAAGGKTVAEIYAARASLKGQEVSVRGKVVKYNAEIMGKNWLHIQDGSGAAGSNDLTITTKNPAKLGDTVLITGKVGLDRDFGGGYRYPLIVEDAKVKVE